MNHKRIIDRYEKHGVNQKARKYCIRFYWDVEDEVQETSSLPKSARYRNLTQLIPVIGEEYGMTEEEAEYVYGIGKEQIGHIDNMTFNRRLIKKQ